jgi:hypothetical protein
MEDPAIHKWLDFTAGRQILSATALMVMAKSPTNIVRAVHDAEGVPYAVVALSNVSTTFRSGMLWAFRSLERPRRGIRAAAWYRGIIEVGFREYELQSIYTAIVDINVPSIRAAEGAGMLQVGRQRLAHPIDGAFRDRLLFDITAAEFFAGE